MINNPLVSVIVPVYGTEEYLPSCIDSIISQSYKNLQILLVDDGSPDNCPEICDSYAENDSRIKVIHQKNTGVSGARNTGLENAVGDYVMFVDSDDEITLDAVEVLLKDAIEYGADIVWAPFKKTDSAGSSDLPDPGQLSFYKDLEMLLFSLNGAFNINSACGKLFKRLFIDGLSFELGKNINEDGFFMFEAYIRKPFVVRHEVLLYKYITRNNSNSRQFFSEKYFSMLYFCERKKEIIKERFPQFGELVHNMEVRTNLQFLDVLCRNRDKKYKKTHIDSVKTVRKLYKYHKPINDHHKKLALIVRLGLYPLYKAAVRFKYYR